MEELGEDEIKEIVEDVEFGNEFGYRIRWKIQNHCAQFSAYEVSGTDCVGGKVKYFHRKDASSYPDDVENIDDAEPAIEGFCKWDGCFQIQERYFHADSMWGIMEYAKLLEHLYRKSCELVPRAELGMFYIKKYDEFIKPNDQTHE